MIYAAIAAVFAVSLGVATQPSPAASAGAVVSATVLSATNLDVSGCASGTAGRTDYGTILPGASAVTSSNCTIGFGSSNDTARLRIAQTDGRGVGMYQTTRGALDTSFDTDGRVTNATAPGANDDVTRAVVVQPDGKIVTSGECDMGAATGIDACLARYNPDGTLDTTFDSDGRVTTATASGSDWDYARGIALQPDGRIVTAGYCYTGATSWDACLARYNTDGSLDTTFGTAGRVTTNTSPSGGADYIVAIAIGIDGRIVTGGYCDMGATTGFDACLARYNSNGTLDTAFDTDGRVTTAFAPGAGTDYVGAVQVQPDGRVAMAGACEMGGTTGRDACLARYNLDGTLDTSFDTDGRAVTVTAPGSGIDQASALVVQDDGRIVTAGSCAMGGATGQDTCLARYNADGSLDTTFDSDGRVTTATAPGAGADYGAGIALQPDGRIVTTGSCDMGATTGFDACLARYDTNGALDTNFDTDGRVTTAIVPGAGTDYANALALGADGRIVSAGNCDVGGATGRDSCLTQYAPGGSVSQYVDTITDWDTAGTSLFGVCQVTNADSTPAWTTSATCPTIDGAYWRGVPTTPTLLATASPNTTTASASLRFGLRTSSSQTPGAYIAPVTFDVVAP